MPHRLLATVACRSRMLSPMKSAALSKVSFFRLAAVAVRNLNGPKGVKNRPIHFIRLMSSIHDRIESWRDKLLDVGNRNPLINCSFSESRGAVEILTDDCESLWRQLCSESEAGSTAMRFPWRRDLVPPTEDWNVDENEEDSKPKVWNPPLDQCQACLLYTSPSPRDRG